MEIYCDLYARFCASTEGFMNATLFWVPENSGVLYSTGCNPSAIVAPFFSPIEKGGKTSCFFKIPPASTLAQGEGLQITPENTLLVYPTLLCNKA